jgi:hypothetical protein
MSEEINPHRRRFFGTAAVTVAAAQLGLIRFANAQSAKPNSALPTITPRTNKSFGALKQIDAGELNIGYAEAGPANGPAVILLHGWPYDIYSFVDVTPMPAAAGSRRDRMGTTLRSPNARHHPDDERCGATGSRRRSLEIDLPRRRLPEDDIVRSLDSWGSK